MSWKLAGKFVLITGAARGIGAQTARELAARGARLSLVGLEPEMLAQLAEELGPDHIWFEADVTDQAAMNAAVSETVTEFGGIDVLVANAGVAPLGTVRHHDPDTFARTIDINLVGVFRSVFASLPHIVDRRGYVLVVSSASAFVPSAGMAAYTASKAGSEAFACALRGELAHLGVGVGSAHPAWGDTDLVRDIKADLPTFSRTLRMLPWPLRSIATVETCGKKFATAIERRARRVYIPRGVMLLHWLRNMPTSGLGERLIRPILRRQVPRMEQEVAALGRSFSSRNERLQR